MKFPFFRHKRNEVAFPVPAGHLRVANFADRLNATITRLEEEREILIAEIADRREDLRQVDAVLNATRAGLTYVVDDVSLTFGAANEARSHIEAKAFSDLEIEIGIADFEETAARK